MVSYVALVAICVMVGAICTVVTIVIGRRDIDGVLRVITADYDDGTYLTLEAHKELNVIAKKKTVRFVVRPEHYNAQD